MIETVFNLPAIQKVDNRFIEIAIAWIPETDSWQVAKGVSSLKTRKPLVIIINKSFSIDKDAVLLDSNF